jgi:hypothetical protein
MRLPHGIGAGIAPLPVERRPADRARGEGASGACPSLDIETLRGSSSVAMVDTEELVEPSEPPPFWSAGGGGRAAVAARGSQAPDPGERAGPSGASPAQQGDHDGPNGWAAWSLQQAAVKSQDPVMARGRAERGQEDATRRTGDPLRSACQVYARAALICCTRWCETPSRSAASRTERP